MKLNAKQLRSHQSSAISKQTREPNDIYIVLDDVLDTYNIGSIFRLADALAVKHIYLCGRTEIPPNHKIKKASINTTEWVNWSHAESPIEVIRNLQFSIPNLQTIAIEQEKRSIPYDKYDYHLPTCFIVGNETHGVSKEVLKECDAIIELPMFGVNISLNVVVSLAIVAYKALEKSR